MAMKIGGEYSSEKILPKHFEKMAEETGLSKPFVRQRIPELAKMVLSKIPKVVIDHPASKAVGNLIQNRCEQIITEFKGPNDKE